MTVYHSVIKNNEILPFGTTWMNPQGAVLIEINQKVKDKNTMITLLYGILKKKTKQNMKKTKQNKSNVKSSHCDTMGSAVSWECLDMV